MSKLSNRFKDTHEEIINSQYNIKCKCTEELKTLYDHEGIDSTMLMGKIMHEYWNYFNCKEKSFLWSYNETTHEYTRNSETQDKSGITSMCLLKSNSHNISLNVGIDTMEENTTVNSYKLITDFDYNNIVLAFSLSNWDKTGTYWLGSDNDNNYSAYNKIHLFYKINKGGNAVELLDMERNISLGIINDNKITCIESINYLNDAQYSLNNTSGDNSLNNFTVGQNINGLILWHGNQERVASTDSTSDNYLRVNRYNWSGTGYVREIHEMSKFKYLRDILASIGLKYILSNPADITTEEQFNNAVHLAYMNEKGEIDYNNILVGTTEINNSDTYNKDLSYDKLPAIDTNTYIDDIKLNENYFDFTSTVFTKMYALNYNDEINLKSDFEEAPTGFDALKSVIAMKSYPFNVANQNEYITRPFTIGGQSFGTNYKELITSYRIINLGQCSIMRQHNNFMDYAPFTDIKLYIPYCTEVNIPPSIAMGKTLSVKMIIDLMTGQCVAIVYCDNIVIAYSAGIIGNDITISSENNALKSASQLQSLLGVGASVLGIAGGVATGNVLGTLSSTYSTLGVVSNAIVNENKNYSESKGATQGIVNNIKPQYCYCTVTTVKPDIPENYGHTVGYIINKKRKLSNCEGYTICSNVDTTSLRCDDNEKERIKNMLETGVYL